MTKSLVLGADVPGNFLSTPEAAILKSLVGGDWKDFELKNSNDTSGGVGLFNVVITANARLRVAGRRPIGMGASDYHRPIRPAFYRKQDPGRSPDAPGQGGAWNPELVHPRRP
jgi:hypothetical protein